MLQPYLDRELSDEERAEAEGTSTTAATAASATSSRSRSGGSSARSVVEEMPPELKQKLAALRTPL